MGIVLGILCVICFLLLAMKMVTRKFHLQKIDVFLMRIHKPICVLLIVLCVLHVISVIPVLKNRSAAVISAGIIAIVGMLLLICLCHTIKEKQKRVHWHKIMTLFFAICIVSHIVAYNIDFGAYQRKVTNVTFEDIHMSKIKDGIYQGEYDAGFIYAKVAVGVKDGKITSIDILEHRNERGKSAEIIIEDILASQELDVDTISGATNSSNVIKKAVENALTSSDTLPVSRR